MPPLHVIHLRDAWEPPVVAEGCIRLERRFGRPTGLAQGDRVVLAVTASSSSAEVILNDAPLPMIAADAGRWSHDVTGLLRDRNRLILSFKASALDAGDRGSGGRGPLPAGAGEVTVEIVSSA